MFTYRRARTPREAIDQLQTAGAVPIGGGTDLLTLIEDGLARPTAVVDVRAVDDWSRIDELADGRLRVGAAVRIATIAEDPRVRERFGALAGACASVGTTALRSMGTLGGNLCQRPRCWYYRGRIPCLKNGGDSCPAASGENQYHAILEGGPCWIVHPSDPAVALLALDAIVEIASPSGGRTIPIEDFYLLPSERMDHETVLERGEMVRAVVIPAESAGWQRYHKVMQRGAWDFALASIAIVRRIDGEIRMAMGGVAPRPWRVPSSIEEDAAAGPLDDDAIAALAERALYDARPLTRNGYKVALAEGLVRRVLAELQPA